MCSAGVCGAFPVHPPQCQSEAPAGQSVDMVLCSFSTQCGIAWSLRTTCYHAVSLHDAGRRGIALHDVASCSRGLSAGVPLRSLPAQWCSIARFLFTMHDDVASRGRLPAQREIAWCLCTTQRCWSITKTWRRLVHLHEVVSCGLSAGWRDVVQ